MENVLDWFIAVCKSVGPVGFIISAVVIAVIYAAGKWISEKLGFDPDPVWILICLGAILLCVVGFAVNVVM